LAWEATQFDGSTGTRAEAQRSTLSHIGGPRRGTPQAFNAVDKNGDGVIDKAELSKELERRGYAVSPEKVASLFSLYANKDGVLKVVEFAELAANLKEDDC